MRHAARCQRGLGRAMRESMQQMCPLTCTYHKMEGKPKYQSMYVHSTLHGRNEDYYCLGGFLAISGEWTSRNPGYMLLASEGRRRDRVSLQVYSTPRAECSSRPFVRRERETRCGCYLITSAAQSARWFVAIIMGAYDQYSLTRRILFFTAAHEASTCNPSLLSVKSPSAGRLDLHS